MALIFTAKRCFEDGNVEPVLRRTIGLISKAPSTRHYKRQTEILIMPKRNEKKNKIAEGRGMNFHGDRKTQSGNEHFGNPVPCRKTSINGTRKFRGLLNALMTRHSLRTDEHVGFPPISTAISGIHRTCLLDNRTKRSDGQLANFWF